MSSAAVGPRPSSAATPYLFLAPALLVSALIVLLPLAQTLWLALHDYVLFRPQRVPFVGLANFARALEDPVFWLSLTNSVLWIGLVLAGQLGLGVAAGFLLNRAFRGRGLARALMVVPWALPSVIIGLVWSWIYDFHLGILNELLLAIGLLAEPVAWLARADTALYGVVLALVWQGFPFFAVVTLAGLQTVPRELLEAAAIDGAGNFARLRHVTLPVIAPVLATALLLRTIWVANSLDVILVMTGGGPGYTTHTLPLYAFLKAYSAMEMGYAAALALWLAALLVLVAWAYVRRTLGEEGR